MYFPWYMVMRMARYSGYYAKKAKKREAKSVKKLQKKITTQQRRQACKARKATRQVPYHPTEYYTGMQWEPYEIKHALPEQHPEPIISFLKPTLYDTSECTWKR